MKSNTRFLKSIAPALALVLLGACANEPTMTETHFGDAVRQMVRAQVYDPSTLETPSAEPADGTDGQMLEGALGTYRSDAASRESVGNAIQISVGAQ